MLNNKLPLERIHVERRKCKLWKDGNADQYIFILFKFDKYLQKPPVKGGVFIFSNKL